MPNMKKITAPKKTTIKGQPHQLAYINDFEEGLLLALGGSGRPVHGIPAFYGMGGGGGTDDPADDMDGPSDGDGDFGGGMNEGQDNTGIADAAGYGPSSGPSDGGGGSNTSARAAEKDFANDKEAMAARGFDVGSEASKAMEQSFASGFNQMGAGLGYNVSGLELDRAFGQLDARMANAKANYGLPGLFGGLLGKIGMTNLENIKSGLQKGHMPAFDKAGQIQGVFGPDPFGFGGLVYSGNPIEGNEATGWSDPTEGGDGYDDRPEVAPVNPLTGTCEDGYIFDDDLNACRLDTESGSDGDGGNGNSNPDGLYFQRSILDDAPKFMPAGMDFDEMNKNFRRAAAYNPQNYENQMDTTGFSLLT